MINFTPIVRKATQRTAIAAVSDTLTSERTQKDVLMKLVKKSRRTAFGKEHGLDSVWSYAQFCRAVPVSDYEAFRPWVMRMINGEADVLWPGKCRRFAQSSGTTGGKSKYIPLTHDSLLLNHYAGAATSVALYLQAYPESRMFAGKGFILGGSYANELSLPPGVSVGDLSATLIDRVTPLVNFFRIPSKKIALMEKWEEKLPRLVAASIKENVTNISGVPSWFLTVLKQAVKTTGATTIHDVWPNLEVFFHGGISFEPYREEYAKIMGHDMHYWENYNASEGFFASQSQADDRSMLLLQNAGVFYEFVPLSEVGKPFPKAYPTWAVEPGQTYALVISACNGLMRYAIGDTVRVESVNPLKITIAGRTASYINAFGEEVMVHNADAAIAKACSQCHCAIANYTVAPIYADGAKKGRHQWLIEWTEAPADTEAFAVALDQALQQENSDYQAKRQSNIFLAMPQVVTAPSGTFDCWLGSTGKLGGQRKVPRLNNDRRIMEQLLALIHKGIDDKTEQTEPLRGS